MGQKERHDKVASTLKSIITDDLQHCIICGRPAERHHIFSGSNRKRSTKDGMILPLCPEHHREGVNAVHNNADMATLVHIIGELVWIHHYSLPFEAPEAAVQRFRQAYGKNYLQ